MWRGNVDWGITSTYWPVGKSVQAFSWLVIDAGGTIPPLINTTRGLLCKEASRAIGQLSRGSLPSLTLRPPQLLSWLLLMINCRVGCKKRFPPTLVFTSVFITVAETSLAHLLPVTQMLIPQCSVFSQTLKTQGFEFERWVEGGVPCQSGMSPAYWLRPYSPKATWTWPGLLRFWSPWENRGSRRPCCDSFGFFHVKAGKVFVSLQVPSPVSTELQTNQTLIMVCFVSFELIWV